MNATSPTAPSDEELGARLGKALERRAGTSAGAISLDAVRRGARSRRARRRAAIGVGCALIAAGGTGLIAGRNPPGSPADQPLPAIPTPLIGAAAVLPASYGEPTDVYATAGGQPYGTSQPAVDVWERKGVRIVVRTVVEAPASAVTDAPAVTVAPPPNTLVAFPADGEIERLADDQWVKYLTSERIYGNHVIVRGADRATAEALFDSMVATDGVLTPPGGFVLTAHADAILATDRMGWYTSIRYGEASEGFAIAFAQAVVSGRDSIELATFVPGVVRTVAGREVHQFGDVGYTSLSWIDPLGYWITVGSDAPLDDKIVSDVELVTQRELEAIAAEVSDKFTLEPVLARATVDGFDLSVRGDTDDVVFCIGNDSGEQCALDVNAGLNAPPIAGGMDTLIGGEWVVFGAVQLVGDEVRADLSADRYTAADGEVLPIETVEADGYLWYVIRVPADSPTLDVSATSSPSGVVGRIGRPVVIGPLG